MYAVPTLYHPSTKDLITDSLRIAEYLNATYPSLPKLVPQRPEGLTRAFVHVVQKEIPTLGPFVVPALLHILPDESKGCYVTSLQKIFRRTLEEITPSTKEERARRTNELNAASVG
jgi:glutathione S-transferase